MTDLGTTGTLLGALMVIANIVVQQVAIAAALGALGPNPYVGIRTDATRRSPGAWRAAHRSVLVLVGAGTVVGVLFAVAGIATDRDGSSIAALLLSLASAVVLTATVAMAAGRAHAVARAHNNS